MNIGIVGLGIIGSANKAGFEEVGHTVTVHDIKLGTTINQVLDTELVFVCVPTPSTDDGRCDTSIVESVIVELIDNNYQGAIAVRSTVIPGFTSLMQEKYSNKKICFVPEFVRERCAEFDFLLEHKLLAVGTDDKEIYALVENAHGNLPRNKVMMQPAEAEILKYYLNLYAATRVTFANVFFEVCKKFGADYKQVKDAYVKTGRLGDMYLDVRDDLRGYGGMCLPKDTRAFKNLIKDLKLDLDFFETVDKDNSKFTATVFDGMRGEN